MEHELALSEESLDRLTDMLQDEFDEKWEGIWNDTDQIVALINDANRLATEDSKNIEKATNALLSMYGVNPSDVREAYDAPVGSYTKIAYGSSRSSSEAAASMGGSSATSYSSGRSSGVGSVDVSSLGIKNGFIVGSEDASAGVPVTIVGSGLEGADLSSMFSAFSNMPSISIPDLSGISGVTINQIYDSLVHVDGSADAATVDDIKNMTSDIMRKSYEYTSSMMYKGFLKSGGRANV